MTSKVTVCITAMSCILILGDLCLRSLADCYPLLEVGDMLMMGNNPDPMCVFTYVQALCHTLCKIEKERKDKENGEKDKAAEGGEKEDGEPEETTESQEDRGDDTETGGNVDEDNASMGCEMEAHEKKTNIIVENES